MSISPNDPMFRTYGPQPLIASGAGVKAAEDALRTAEVVLRVGPRALALIEWDLVWYFFITLPTIFAIGLLLPQSSIWLLAFLAIGNGLIYPALAKLPLRSLSFLGRAPSWAIGFITATIMFSYVPIGFTKGRFQAICNDPRTDYLRRFIEARDKGVIDELTESILDRSFVTEPIGTYDLNRVDRQQHG